MNTQRTVMSIGSNLPTSTMGALPSNVFSSPTCLLCAIPVMLLVEPLTSVNDEQSELMLTATYAHAIGTALVVCGILPTPGQLAYLVFFQRLTYALPIPSSSLISLCHRSTAIASFSTFSANRSSLVPALRFDAQMA